MELDISNVDFYLKIYIEHFGDIEFYTKLNFVKIKFQNRGILLNSFKTKTICYIVFKLGVNTDFGPKFSIQKWVFTPNLKTM